MAYTIALLANHLEFFEPSAGAMTISGAHLTISSLLHYIAEEPEVEALEVYLPPALMVRHDALQRAANSLLPPHRGSQTTLHFYAIHSLPEIWADGKPRIFLENDPEFLVRSRYLRDRFAAGPTPLVCDTHTLGHYDLWKSLAPLASARPVSFDSIVCLSQSTKVAFQKGFGGYLKPEGSACPCRLDVIPHAVDLALFKPATAEAQSYARRTLGLPASGQITLYLGRVTAYSKADLLPLLESFAAASERPDDYLVIAGIEYPAGYRENLRRAAIDLGLADRVIIHKEVAPVMRALYYTASDLFVLPADSVIETLGNVVMEASASGLPVIASDWDGLRDSLQDGVGGRLIPTWWIPGTNNVEAISPASTQMTDYLLLSQSVWVDTGALEKALRDLLDSPAERVRMGKAGRAFMENNVSISAVMKRWTSLWSELMQEAIAEKPSERTDRQSLAEKLAVPVPYLDIFNHYATGVMDIESRAVRLTPKGHTAASDLQKLTFYDDTLPLLRNNVLAALMTALARSAAKPLVMGQLARQGAQYTGQSEDTIMFHIALLLKRGLLEVCDARALPLFSAPAPIDKTRQLTGRVS